MRYTIAAIALCATACACPTAPVKAAEPWHPLHHGIPATFAGDPRGPVVWLCATYPRLVIQADGTARTEEDHYLQYTPCPLHPID